MIKFLIKLMSSLLNTTYFFMKLAKSKKQIVFLSRQSNNLSLDMKLIINELKKRNIDYKVAICKIEKKKLLTFALTTLKQMWYLATSEVAIIDSYVIPVSVLKHKKNLKVIQIWHALGAIKQFGYQTLDKTYGSSSSVSHLMRMHFNYDFILSCGPASTDFFSKGFNYTKDKFVYIGLPRLDYLKLEDNSCLVEYNLGDKPVVLYAPTFRKGEDLLFLQEFVDGFDYRNFDLVVKLHPLDKTKIENEKVILDKTYSSIDWLKVCDIFISDYSAMIFEAAAIHKPIFLFLPDYDIYVEKCGLNYNLFELFGKYAISDVKTLVKVIGEEYDTYYLESFVKESFYNLEMNNTEEFVKMVESLLKGELYGKNTI